MTQPDDPSDLLVQLITRLHQAQIDWDAENIADVLWFARLFERSQIISNTDSINITNALRSSQPVEELAPITDSTQPNNESNPIETVKDPPTPSPPSTLSLYGQEQPAQPRQSAKGLPFQTPTAPALRQTLSIGRSLRPLMRKVNSYRRTVLDEEATAEQTAERQFCMTVVKPDKEHWLEVALVIEHTPASFIWQETLQALQQLLERQGAFRSVRVWHLQTAQTPAAHPGESRGEIQLLTHRPSSRFQTPRSFKELVDPSGRRLILVVSDCISAAWQTGLIHDRCLDLWAKHNPISIMQLLPERLWGRTALRSGVPVKLSSLTPGAINTGWILHEVPVWSNSQTDRGLKLPIVTLEPESLALWAKMMAGFGENRTAGVWFDEGWRDWIEETSIQSGDLSAEQLVYRFNTTASLLARKLAILMSIVPVQLPIIHLIQATMLPESTPLHLAEVYMSGLIVLEARAGQSGKSYEFVPGVREQLVDLADPGVAEQLLDRVSQYVGQKIGRSIYSFTALLLERELQETGEADLLKFAAVTKQAVKRLGGTYAELVKALDAQTVMSTPSVAPMQFPPLQTLKFTWVQLVEEEKPQRNSADLTLNPFEFTVAKIHREGPQQIIQKKSQQAYRFLEELAPKIVLEMVAISDGSFLMGSPQNEPGHYDAESPQHEVTVPSFFMGRYPVTQAQWRFVAGLPLINQELYLDPSRFKGDNRPVEQISWHDAVEFCARLSVYTGRLYRLPSEAEWEYACRAGTTTPFHFGQTIITKFANYDGTYTYNGSFQGAYKAETTPVDQFGIANAFGLCDMHGNVREWCADQWHNNYQGAPKDGSAWVDSEADKNSSRILRGGSWINDPRYCRSATRFSFNAGVRFPSYGFRVVCLAPGLFPPL